MNWWEDFYGEELAVMLLRNTDPEHEKATTSFLRETLNIDGSSTLFDQCCGEGRLSIPFALAGTRVFGVDQSEPYIERANALSSELDATYEVGDALTYVPAGACDAAFNWWTSFGYAATDEENVKMIARAYDALRSDGRFALDFVNVLNVLHDFKPNVVTRVITDEGELVLTRETKILPREDVMEKQWIYVLPDGQRVEYTSRVRTYTPYRLTEFFEDVGFRDVRLFGSVDRTELSIESPRCIVVGTK